MTEKKKAHFYLPLPPFYMVPDGKGSWVNAGPIGFYSAEIGRSLFIPEGHVNNLSSVPFGAKNIVPKNGNNRLGAPPHDYFYEIEGELDGSGITRKEADIVYREILSMPYKDVLKAFSSDLVELLEKTESGRESLERMKRDKAIVNKFARNVLYAALRSGGWVYWRD